MNDLELRRVEYEMQWRRPTLTIYETGTRRTLRVWPNRYPGCLIGVAVQVGTTVVGVTWGVPGRQVLRGRHRRGG